MSDFGFTDNFDKRYNSGWRHWLLVIGLAEIQLVRKTLGGKWEAWWIEPCLSYVWHPVTQKSCSRENIRPCPAWSPLFFAEEY